MKLPYCWYLIIISILGSGIANDDLMPKGVALADYRSDDISFSVSVNIYVSIDNRTSRITDTLRPVILSIIERLPFISEVALISEVKNVCLLLGHLHFKMSFITNYFPPPPSYF